MENLLEERIAADLKDALKRSLEARVGVLRLLRAALQNRAIEKRGRGDASGLSVEEVTAVLSQEAKKRREAALLFRKGNRPELALQEDRERAVVEEYLPRRADREEIRRVAERVIESGIPREFGPAMQAVMRELTGRADGAEVSAIVREILGQ